MYSREKSVLCMSWSSIFPPVIINHHLNESRSGQKRNKRRFPDIILIHVFFQGKSYGLVTSFLEKMHLIAWFLLDFISRCRNCANGGSTIALFFLSVSLEVILQFNSCDRRFLSYRCSITTEWWASPSSSNCLVGVWFSSDIPYFSLIRALMLWEKADILSLNLVANDFVRWEIR